MTSRYKIREGDERLESVRSVRQAFVKWRSSRQRRRVDDWEHPTSEFI